jgi:hypothetical protein
MVLVTLDWAEHRLEPVSSPLFDILLFKYHCKDYDYCLILALLPIRLSRYITSWRELYPGVGGFHCGIYMAKHATNESSFGDDTDDERTTIGIYGWLTQALRELLGPSLMGELLTSYFVYEYITPRLAHT